jgi:hypothetical protein
VLPGEDAAEFAALEAALLEELAPEGALQAALAQRVVSAVWRLARAERLEVDLFAEERLPGRSLGLALIRECNGARAFDTLLRYRGGALAELWRALRTLKALQAEQAAPEPAVVAAPRLLEPREVPIEPESRENPGDSGRPGSRVDEPIGNPALAWLPPWPFPKPAAPAPGGPAPCVQPIEPETRGKPGPAPRSLRAEIGQKSESASLLAGTALVPPGRPGGA